MTEVEVRARILGGEDEHTEFKEWTSPSFPDPVGKAVCAFANSSGGVVVLGVNDSGVIVGVARDPDSVHEAIANSLGNSFNVSMSAQPGRMQGPNGGWIHWIEAPPYRGPEPMRFKGRVYVRHGRSSVEPSPAELAELYNRFGFLHTEERVVPGATPADLDTEVFRAYLERLGLDLTAEPQPALIADLRNRGVVDDDQGVVRPTLYGLLCFGRQPQSHAATRSDWIELVRYAGTDRADEVLLRGEAKGRLDEQVERAMGWLQGLGTREAYRGLQRIDRPLAPLKALREGLVNAVAHRDYAITGSKVLVEVFTDRIDITSPGELPNHMSEAAVLAGGHPRSRNELVASYLQNRGFMEMRGRGLPIIRHEMRRFNGTSPQLVNSRDGRYVRLTLLLDTTGAAVGQG